MSRRRAKGGFILCEDNVLRRGDVYVEWARQRAADQLAAQLLTASLLYWLAGSQPDAVPANVYYEFPNEMGSYRLDFARRRAHRMLESDPSLSGVTVVEVRPLTAHDLPVNSLHTWVPPLMGEVVGEVKLWVENRIDPHFGDPDDINGDRIYLRQTSPLDPRQVAAGAGLVSALEDYLTAHATLCNGDLVPTGVVYVFLPDGKEMRLTNPPPLMVPNV